MSCTWCRVVAPAAREARASRPSRDRRVDIVSSVIVIWESNFLMPSASYVVLIGVFLIPMVMLVAVGSVLLLRSRRR